MAQQQTLRDVVVFDLGGVLIDWNPRHLFRSMFPPDGDEMERFLSEVCSPAWIARIDAGEPFAGAVADLCARHPEHEAMIRAFHERWPETVAGAIGPTVRVVEDLKAAGVRLLALSNWSAETFPLVAGRFPFLRLFEGVLISGDAGYAKPAPEIFEGLLEQFSLDVERCVFVDDHEPNVKTARSLGFDAIRFVDSDDLRAELERRGLLAVAA
jgi:2-haloacid dehalogenase